MKLWPASRSACTLVCAAGRFAVSPARVKIFKVFLKVGLAGPISGDPVHKFVRIAALLSALLACHTYHAPRSPARVRDVKRFVSPTSFSPYLGVTAEVRGKRGLFPPL